MQRTATLLEMPKISDSRGSLSFVESGRHLPFNIERVFYLYDVPGGEMRAGHALRSCEQVLIALSGSFDVYLDDGMERNCYKLNRPNIGLHIPSEIWREIENFSSGAVCLSLASEPYDPEGYWRDYGEFVAAVRRSSS